MYIYRIAFHSSSTLECIIDMNPEWSGVNNPLSISTWKAQTPISIHLSPSPPDKYSSCIMAIPRDHELAVSELRGFRLPTLYHLGCDEYLTLKIYGRFILKQPMTLIKVLSWFEIVILGLCIVINGFILPMLWRFYLNLDWCLVQFLPTFYGCGEAQGELH